MGIEKVEEDKKRKNEGDGFNKNGVIVTVYMESNMRHQHKNFDPGRANKQKQWSNKHSKSTMHGNDRKAQLLAYARELRYNSQEAKWPRKNLRSKIKWKWKPSRLKYRVSILRILSYARRRWKFDHIMSEKKKKAEERSSLLGEINGSRKTPTQRKDFFKRLRCILKEISCGWKCSKG